MPYIKKIVTKNRNRIRSSLIRKDNSIVRVGFLTLGCKVNAYETEKMKLQFEEAGHRIVAFGEKADVYVVNTCTVTNIADRKSRKMLHRARRMNPEAVVVAAGCYVDSAKKKGEVDDVIDLFITNAEKPELVEKVLAAREKKNAACLQETTEPDGENHMTEKALEERHTRAYLKVQDGCNQYCTYCIIPYVRGELKSKTIEEAAGEAKALAAEGIHEVVVTGIHLSSYGVDFTEKKSFLELEGRPLLQLLRRIAEVDGIERIRLGSLEPRIITEEFTKELSEIPKICPHFHLSLQSGCDETLRRMNRHYTAEEYLDKLAVLRKYFENPAVTTDIIVGFVQETEEEFLATCDFAKKAAFAKIHVFKYSRRQGTMADAMKGQLTEGIKAERSDILLDTGKELEKKYQENFLQKEEFVLFEEVAEICGKEYLVGYNERYVRIGVPAAERKDAERRCNTTCRVHITDRITDEILLGESC